MLPQELGCFQASKGLGPGVMLGQCRGSGDVCSQGLRGEWALIGHHHLLTLVILGPGPSSFLTWTIGVIIVLLHTVVVVAIYVSYVYSKRSVNAHYHPQRHHLTDNYRPGFASCLTICSWCMG